ncbi:hypothetical protein GCK72_023450 [Caenorhabditis remanei]|uniref:Uncharacterized protein n=1 Tax=Caenorhabditis remanei TaxID=31234 RepID=A0A6A5FWU3_CAERE|nr:hypothetical protein GCK72_023450 [Caenorhabditis remanei]KAF1746992.1 hypothetical protein GCK72_023450 [Caenorhabditis remanei]
MGTTLVLTVILALLQTVASTPESSSNVTTTTQLSFTAVDNRFNAETLVLKSNMFSNGNEKEAKNVQDYTIIKMGDENQWRALNDNSSSLVVLSNWSSEAAEFRLAKCGFFFNYTINIRPNTIFNVDRDLLNAFNQIKHTYCSNGTDDDLSFQLLVTRLPPSVDILIRFSVLPIPEDILGSSVIYFIWYSMSAAITAIFLICYFSFLGCAYRQNQNKATYYVNPKTAATNCASIFVHPSSRKSFSNA